MQGLISEDSCYLRKMKIRLLSGLLTGLLLVSCSVSDSVRRQADGWIALPEGFAQRYQLTEMVVLSRHNIRSPLAGGNSVLSRLTPHTWYDWTSAPGELSVKGGELEVLMGGFFREWLQQERLFGRRGIPPEGAVRFYANSLQRTQATAACFTAGLLPGREVEVERRAPLGTMDPVFNPQTTGVDEAFEALALSQIAALGGPDGWAGIGRKVAGQVALLEQVLDLRDSPAAQHDTVCFVLDDVRVSIRDHAEPAMQGGLKLATSAADALVLQYYEEQDDRRAAFGDSLGLADWQQIAAVVGWYQDVLFATPAIARNVAAPLLREIRSELLRPGRRFTLLCGHDSNLGSVLSALDCADFTLPDAVERKTPVGSKLVFEKWRDRQGGEYVGLLLVYASADQLRRARPLSLSEPPSCIRLALRGLPANADGLYRLDDLLARMAD